MPSHTKVVDICEKRAACEHCIVSRKCLDQDHGGAAACLFRDNAGQVQLLHRGDYLFRAGDSMNGLYIIRSGIFKTYFVSEDGEEQILGFHLPGDIIGFDGIAGGEFASNAMALDTASVCRLPFETFNGTGPGTAQFQQALLKGMSREILRQENMLMLLGKKKADERLASFLYSHSVYQTRRGYSATVLTLAMTRTDIGKYLGLTVETISRVLSRLQVQGIIEVRANRIHILDLDALQALSGDAGERPRARAHTPRPHQARRAPAPSG